MPLKTISKHLFKISILSVLFLIHAGYAHAQMLVTPVQVTMEGRARSSEIIIVNTSDKTQTYRLGWKQYDQLQDSGGYTEVETLDPNKIYLQNMAVFSPRQVTLSPGEKQTIRIAVRRPAELPDGEYKSHLRFQILPASEPAPPVTPDPGLKENEIRVGARVNTSYNIPILYRAGDYDIKVDIESAQLSTNSKTGKLIADIAVTRSGTHGAVGQLDIYHTPASGGGETLVGQLANSSLFAEITRRNLKAPLNVSTLAPGNLRVVYLKAEGQTSDYVKLAEKTFPVN
jgi:P pilus assembly chaperone PapD